MIMKFSRSTRKGFKKLLSLIAEKTAFCEGVLRKIFEKFFLAYDFKAISTNKKSPHSQFLEMRGEENVLIYHHFYYTIG